MFHGIINFYSASNISLIILEIALYRINIILLPTYVYDASDDVNIRYDVIASGSFGMAALICMHMHVDRRELRF